MNRLKATRSRLFVRVFTLNTLTIGGLAFGTSGSLPLLAQTSVPVPASEPINPEIKAFLEADYLIERFIFETRSQTKKLNFINSRAQLLSADGPQPRLLQADGLTLMPKATKRVQLSSNRALWLWRRSTASSVRIRQQPRRRVERGKEVDNGARSYEKRAPLCLAGKTNLLRDSDVQFPLITNRFEYSISQNFGNRGVTAQIIAHQELDVGTLRLRFFQKRRQIVCDVIARMKKIGHGNNAPRALLDTTRNRLRNRRLVAFHETDFDRRVFAPCAQHIHNGEHIAVRFGTRASMNHDQKR